MVCRSIREWKNIIIWKVKYLWFLVFYFGIFLIEVGWFCRCKILEKLVQKFHNGKGRVGKYCVVELRNNPVVFVPKFYPHSRCSDVRIGLFLGQLLRFAVFLLLVQLRFSRSLRVRLNWSNLFVKLGGFWCRKFHRQWWLLMLLKSIFQMFFCVFFFYL